MYVPKQRASVGTCVRTEAPFFGTVGTVISAEERASVK